MLYTLKNDQLTVLLNDFGAELHSVKRGACEYIWQGDPAYWAGQAPILFPICGRLFGGKYTYEGKEYEMTLHGFAKRTLFQAEVLGENEICFRLSETEATLAEYPFPFSLEVTYRLNGAQLESEIRVKNTGRGVLPFAFGAHPGFNVPLEGGEFSDYYVEFGEPTSPDKLVFSDTCFNTGYKTAYPLEDGRRIPLSHEMFQNDAVFLCRVADSVTLRSEKSERYVQFFYPGMPYLGLWHKPNSDAPYVCIEPWCGLPSFDGKVDDFAVKSDMFRLQPQEEKRLQYSLLFG